MIPYRSKGGSAVFCTECREALPDHKSHSSSDQSFSCNDVQSYSVCVLCSRGFHHRCLGHDWRATMMDFWLCVWCHRLEAGKGECGGEEGVVVEVWGEHRLGEMLRIKKCEYSVGKERMNN